MARSIDAGAAKDWLAAHIPDQTGRTAIVTGANTGLGYATAEALAAKGAHVVLAVRNLEKGKEAAQRIEDAAPGADVELQRLDLGSLASVRQAAEELRSKHERIDLLINNAGILVSGERFGNVKAESLAESFAVNATAPLLITQALAPLLALGNKPRVLCITSQLGSIAQASGFRTISYAMSKAALTMAVKRLAAELTPRGIVVLAAHPGWVKTDMGGAEAPLEVSEGGKTSVQLATLPADGPSGGFFHLAEALPW